MPSFFRKNKRQQQEQPKPNMHMKQGLYTSLNENIDTIKQKTGNSPDITIRTLNIDVERKTKIAIVYVEGIVDENNINEFIVEPIMKSQDRYDGTHNNYLIF